MNKGTMIIGMISGPSSTTTMKGVLEAVVAVVGDRPRSPESVEAVDRLGEQIFIHAH